MNLPRRRLAICTLLSLAALCGCNPGEDIRVTYGRREMESVNGTDVFYRMTQQAGHRTTSKYHFVPQSVLNRVDAIVWMPDTYQFPSERDRELIDSWLKQKSGRTLIFVGRDYDSEPVYWEKIKLTAPATKLPEIRRRLLNSRAEVAQKRREMPDELELEWFDHKKLKTPLRFGSGGKPPVVNGTWARQAQQAGKKLVDPAALELSLGSRIDPPFDADVLLAVDGEIIVTREDVRAGEEEDGESHVVVVANASFLTNVALVNHQHRKLARQLVEELEPDQQVLFLETDAAGIYREQEGEDSTSAPSLQILTAPRLTHTFLHLAGLAIIFGFSCWPIFGRARQLPTHHESDFGRHVEALGAMLEQGGRADFALARVQHYQDLQLKEAAREPAAS